MRFFFHLTKQNGLPSDFVMYALRDFRGYTWIATDNGLARYDGRRVTTFQRAAKGGNSIVDNYVIFLKETSDSMLWIGTRNGVSVYDPFKASFRNYPYAPSGRGNFPCKFIRTIFEDRKGNVWLGTNDGCVMWSRKSQQFEKISLECRSKDETRREQPNFVTSFAEDPRTADRFFIGTLEGVVLFDRRTRTVVQRYPNVVHGNTGVFDMYMEGSRFLWTCGWFTGLNCLDIITGRWKQFPQNPNSPATFLSIVPKGNNEFWLASIDQGIGIFDKLSGTFSFIRHDPLKENSILSDDIHRIITLDSNRTLWFTGPRGISVGKENVLDSKTYRPPFSSLSLTTVLADRNSDRLFVGAFWCEGLFVYSRNSGSWKIVHEANRNPGLPLLISAMCQDSAGVLWLATDRNLLYYDQEKNVLRLFLDKSGQPIPFADKQLYSVYEDPMKNLWVGTRSEGVVKLDPSRQCYVWYRHQKGDQGSLVDGTVHRAIIADRFGRIWISNQGGVSIYNPTRNRFDNSFNDTLRKYGVGDHYIFDIKRDISGRFWMSADGLGLLCVTVKSPGSYSIRLFDTSHGLVASSISSMDLDADGDLWINNVGLLCMNTRSEKIRALNDNFGLEGQLGIGQKLYSDRDQNIYIVGSEALNVFRKRDIAYLPVPENLVVEAIEINGKRIDLGYSRKGPNEFVLRGTGNNITFFYTAIGNLAGSQRKYMFKLDGYDKIWNYPGNTQEARYTHLPPGDYEFVFKVLDQPDPGTLENLVRVRIVPWFWQTAWFYSLVALILVSLVYLLYRYRIRHLLSLERLRTRIATDLHDDVGSTLSSISILSEMLIKKTSEKQSLKMLGTIGESSSLMMEKLDDIVWVVNPANDKVRDLSLRIREYAIPFCESKGIEFSLLIDDHLDHARLTVDLRRALYLVAKEAINNAIKYAGCKSIRLELSIHQHWVELMVSDDGCGFDAGMLTSRNGIRNMKSRAESVGGTLEVKSVRGAGTEIQFRARLRRALINTA